ncbi:MAG TPA: hypothetical protein DC049_17355 [Spirochaetia bacterium]|nr:hypothetical protein [Spirochaetia bacterium]
MLKEIFGSLADFPLHVTASRVRLNSYPQHFHDCHELMIVSEGEAQITIDGKINNLQKGDLLVMRAGTMHGFPVFRNFTRTAVFFNLENLLGPVDDLSGISAYRQLFAMQPAKKYSERSAIFRLPHKSLLPVLAVCREMQMEINRQTTGYQAMARSLFIKMLVMIIRHYRRIRTGSDHLDKIIDTASWLENNFPEKITLSFLCERINLSMNTFLRHFHKTFRQSPMQYLCLVRLKKARSLLVQGALPVTQISRLCGFNDSNYFCRMFRREYGESPLRYRRKRVRQQPLKT